MVWRDYDTNNTYNIDDWQRVSSSEEFIEKVLELRDPKVFDSKLKEYRNNYKKVLLSEEEYYKEFKNKMDYALDKTC